MSRIGEKIAQVRTKKGLSQKVLAKKLGVGESFIKDVELGRKVMNEALVEKASKVLGEDMNDLSLIFEDSMEDFEEVTKKSNYKTITKVNDQWNDALSSVLKTVPIYGFDLNKVIDKKQLPVSGNKVNGYAQDKVFFLKIENDDMLGFRICKDDIAFAHIAHEVENNAICLVEYNGERVLRQIKKLDSEKYLLISNKNSLKTETINKRELKILGKLEYLEIRL